MAGYIRQATADIVPTATVRAAPINAEYNALRDAFAESGGHKHDGTSAEGDYVPLIADSDTFNKVAIDTNNNRVNIFVEVAAASVEQLRIQDGVIVPVTDNDIDLGTSALEFKNLYLDGIAKIDTLTVDENATVAGTLGVTGAVTLSSTLGVTGVLTASAGVIGNVTGNTAGIHTGNVTGNLTGNVTGNITSTGTSTFTTVDINGGAIDGTVIGAAVKAAGSFTTITTTGQAALASADINAGTIDGAVIGGASAQAVTGTLITATTGFAGGLTGNVVGNLTGNVTGNSAGTHTGAVVGNVTAATGSSTFNDMQINGTLNMDSGTVGTITGLSTPVNATDAATKAYADAADALKLNLAGGTMSGAIAMGTNKITGLGTPVASTDAANKGYVDTSIAAVIDAAPAALDTLNELAAALNDDANFSTTITNSIATKLPKAGGTMTGDIVLGANKATSTATPATADTLTRKGYVDSQDALKLNLSGGTMSGAIAMGTSKITGLGDPTVNQDAATKAYADAQDALRLALTGGTMAGSIVMGSNKITTTADPVAADDLTRKGYIDTLYGSTVSAATSAANAATSASNAATSETNAGNSASAASASEINAAASESAASTSESNASGSASAAATSETNADTSETNAALSETNAALSETNAAASETNAAASESAASTSETNAATSASNASGSASAAATSETNAATSETNAAASYDAFDDRYLGAKASAPTLDNDGNALLTGALYWNTSSEALFVWTGSVWNAAAFDTSGALVAINNLSDVQDAATARTNLGLGTAATSAATDFVAVTGDSMTGPLSITASSASAAVFNRTTTEGDIVSFESAGVSAGKIGISGGFYVMGDGISGLLYDPGTPSILPFNYSGNDLAYGTLSLGLPSAQWKKVYTKALNINGAIEFPTADGTSGQVLATNGSGVITFADAASDTMVLDNKTVAYTVVSGDLGKTIYVTGNGTFTISLTSAATLGLGFNVKIWNTGNGTITINPAGSEYIDSATGNPQVLYAYEGIELVSNGTNWYRGTRRSSLYYAENANNANHNLPVASGTYSFAIGGGAISSGNVSIALGGNVTASGANSTSIGRTSGNTGAVAAGNGAVSLSSYASGTNSLAAAIGNNTSTYGATGSYSVAIGKSSKASGGLDSVAIGTTNISSGFASWVFGSNSTASGNYSLALGYNNVATGTGSMAIGTSASSTVANLIALGGTGNTVQISGTYTLPTTDGTVGQVMTTDGAGAVTFVDQTITAYTAGSGLGLAGTVFSHADTSAQASLTALTGANVVSDIDVDTYGHVTALATRAMTAADLGALTSNQTITLSGDASGSGTTSIVVTVADDSHNHIIANVDGLQTALDGKAASSHTHTAAQITDFDAEVANNSAVAANTAKVSNVTTNLGYTTAAATGTVTSSDGTNATLPAATTSLAGLLTGADKTKLDGIETGATADQTATEILTAIKTVDGASSGLDADLLDGQQGSYYTAYADTAVSNLVAAAPSTLDTLNELAAALGDDPNFATTVTNSIATKLPLSGGTMSGAIAMGNNKITGVLNPTLSLDAANKTYVDQVADLQLSLSGGTMSGAITTTSTFDGRDVSVDGTKLDGIAAGAQVNVATNLGSSGTGGTRTITSSTGTDTSITYTAGDLGALTANQTITLSGDLTGSGTTSISAQIAANVVGANELNVTGNGTATQFLRSDGDGTFTWAAASPELYAENPVTPTAPSATGANAIAIGNSALASDANSLAGPLSRAAGSHSVALGIANNSASYGAGGSYSISMGYQSRAMASQSLALGQGAYVDSDSLKGLALGSGPYVQQCDYGIAIGKNARVYGGNTATEATAIGSSYASGTASFAAAIGNITSSYGATGANSIAIGQLAKATAADSVAIGNTATSTTANLIALGGTTDTVQISGTYTLPTTDGTTGQVLTTNGAGVATFADAGGGGSALELYAENPSSPTAPSATGTNAVAIGSGSKAASTDAIGLGVGSWARSDRTFAVFGDAQPSSIGAVAIGYSTVATGGGAVALGQDAYGLAAGAVALGKSRASGTDSFAAAIDNNTATYGATGANSIAMGYLANATQADGIAIGDRVVATGNPSIAVGRQITASGAGSAAFGINYSGNNIASGENSLIVTMGGVTASGKKSAIFGGYSKATAERSFAFGTNAASDSYGKFAFSAKGFSADYNVDGSAQAGLSILSRITTDGTSAYLSGSTGAVSTNQIILPNNSAYAFSGTIVARQKASCHWNRICSMEGRRSDPQGSKCCINGASQFRTNCAG